jgi:hypothetical protein
MKDSHEKHSTTFNANPTQRAFIESRAEADLFASRKGEGKSAGLAWASYFYTHHNQGAPGLCVRDTWENLRRTTLDEFFHWFPDGVYGDWSGLDKTWHWNKKRTGLEGKLTFMGVESKEDAQKIASMNLAYALIDEPAPAANSSAGIDEFVFDTIMGQLRFPGMKWYACKLATNNPDQTHWSFKRFVKPGTPPMARDKLPMQDLGFRCWQTREPENVDNLPPGYYEAMAQRWKDRKDLLRRFVEGKFGFQSKGKSVTPEWNDDIHLASGLMPVKGLPLKLGWDGGHNPTCIISQVTPLGDWLVLDSFVGEGIGMYELIEDVVKPRILERYPWVPKIPLQALRHTGDPNLETGSEATTTQQLSSAHKVILSELGGIWTPGPVDIEGRVDPLRGVLRKTRDGRGLMMVDRDNAEHVWYALRGGWHYRITRGGVVGSIVKDEHSHPGDATGYLAGLLFPGGKIVTKKAAVESAVGNYYNRSPGGQTAFLGAKGRGIVMPDAGKIIGNVNKQLPYKF